MTHRSKYLVAFFITLGIFAVAFLLSEFLYNTRIGQVKSLEENISQNILETEIQYDLLADSACETDEDTTNALFVDTINNLASKLQYMEDERGSDDPEVITLKKHYSLLQVKNYLLLKETARRCGNKEPTVLYFYSNKGDCADCKKEGYVLTNLRQTYPNLHVYAFDYNIGLSVVDTLKSIYKLENNMPIIVVNRKPYYGFKTREDIEDLIPELATSPKATSTTATTTARK